MLALKTEENQEKTSITIHISGEVDASSSIELDTRLGESIQKGYKSILIDCSDLQYISSAGLGVFMSYLEELKTNGQKMVLYGMSEKVKNIFTLLGLDNLLQIVDDENAAKAIG